jgi:hypothetical protein
MSQVMEIKSAREESAPEMRDVCASGREEPAICIQNYGLISFRSSDITSSLSLF